MTDRTVSVKLTAQITDYTSKLGQAGRITSQFGQELGALGKKNSAAMRDIENGAGVAGLAMAGLAGYVIKVGMEFDKQMSQVKAVTNASAEEMQGLRDAAIEAGKATVFSASEAAKAETELGKAGISTADIMGGALTGSLALAAAGGLDLAESADIAAKAMNIWGLEGKDVTHIADVLASSANKSATDVHEMGEALRMGGLVAKQAGLSLEDTVGTLSAFADRALVGSDAGTSLKTMLMFLAKPTNKAAELMKELGIQTYDASGKFVGIEKLAGNLQTALSGLTQEQRQAAMAIIFGSDATRAATVLYELGAQGIHDYITAVNDSGAAQRAASTMTDNLAGDLERLKGSLESLMIESQAGATGGLRSVVQTLDALVEKFSALPGPVQSAAVILTGISGVALLVTAGFLKMRRMTGELVEALNKGGPASQRFATGLQTSARWAGRAALAFGVLQVATVALDAATGDAVHVDALSDSLADLGKSGDINGELVREFGEDLHGFSSAVALSGDGVNGFVRSIEGMGPGLKQLDQAINGESFVNAEQKIRALDAALAQMIKNGNVEQAIAAANRLMVANGMTWDQIEKALPDFTSAMMHASDATKDGAAATADAAGQTKNLADATGKATEEIKSLTDAWDELHGKTLSADESLLAAHKAIDDVTASFKENGKAINGNSDAALNNRIAMARAAQAAADAAQKYYDLTGDIDGAMKIMQDQRKAAEDAAIANGGNAKSVNRLADELFKLPKQTTANVDVDGAKAGQAAVDSLHRAINNLPKSKTVYLSTFTTNTTTNVLKTVKIASAQRWGGVIEHAQAGLVNAGIYGAGSQPLYAFAEPQTGGEAFVPKYGNYGRSMSILSQAASWYGASVVPQGGGRAVYNITVNVPPTANMAEVGRVTVRAIQEFERGSGTGWRS